MIFEEKKIQTFPAILLLAVCFFASFQPWMMGLRELFFNEGLYAALASQLNGFPPSLVVNGERFTSEYPLYPLLVKWLCSAGLSMECALRTVPLVSLMLLSCIVFYCCYCSAGIQAAFAGSAAMFSCVLASDKTLEGTPVLLTALGIFSVWMVWFEFGIRKGNWTVAWTFSGLLGGLTFYAAGFYGLVLTFVPMFFLRRPLGFWTKKRGTAFVIGVILLSFFILLWEFPIWQNLDNLQVAPSQTFLPAFGKYLLHLLIFPCDLFFRFLPWTLFLWAPFCPQLAPLDPAPLMSRYLKTLFAVSVCLLWFSPSFHGRDFLLILAPISALTGIRYWIVVRRYGWTLQKFCFWCALFALVFQLIVLLLTAMPHLVVHCRSAFPEIQVLNLSSGMLIEACVSTALGILAACSVIVMERSRKPFPVWLMLLLVVTSFMMPIRGYVAHYSAAVRLRSQFGLRLKQALPVSAGKETVYKLSDVPTLYIPLHYAGFQVKNIASAKDLPADRKTIYVISHSVPAVPERTWKRLFTEKYIQNSPVELWQGDLRDEP